MATKSKVSYDETHGLYHRFLGKDANGRKPHFWLGSNESQAEQRAARLELLWSQVEADWKELPAEYPNWLGTALVKKPDRPVWDEITLPAAKSIAKGGLTFPLPRNPSWSAYHYTLQLTRVQRRFSAVVFVPADEDKKIHEAGVDIHRLTAQQEIERAQKRLASLEGRTGQTWHQAIDAYITHLEKLPDTSGWYKTQIKQCRRLKEHHADVDLSALGLNKVEEFINFWRHRPTIKEKTIAATTARNQIIQLGIVLKWLYRNEHFQWRKPEGMEDLKQTVKDNDRDRVIIETFTVDELKTLWRYASPLMRLEICLALNCGFKYAEIASLALNEVYLNSPYPGIVRTDRPEGLGDWIVRIRRKTKVYGEWQLWPWTATGIAWAKANRKGIVKKSTDFLLVTRSGKSLDAPTKSNNKSAKIYSSWKHLYATINKHQSGFRYLPFKNLEKTATDWIRAKFGWEIANLFTCHGKPVKQDTQLEAYSNKPYPRLFVALAALEQHLRAVFESVPEPWKSGVQNRPTARVATTVIQGNNTTTEQQET
jgi:hypothetical protein